MGQGVQRAEGRGRAGEVEQEHAGRILRRLFGMAEGAQIFRQVRNLNYPECKNQTDKQKPVCQH